jgi:AcrR family transcriptional regulator
MTVAEARDWALPALQARSQEKRDRLVNAGLRLIEDVPYARLTVSEIAREAGYGVGTFYRRFPDRQHFLFALQELANREFLLRLETEVPEPATPAETVSAVVTLLVDDRRRRRGLATASLREATMTGGAWMPFYEAAIGCDQLLRSRLAGPGSTNDSRIEPSEISFVTQAFYGILNQTTLLQVGATLLDDDALVERLSKMGCRYLAIGHH